MEKIGLGEESVKLICPMLESFWEVFEHFGGVCFVYVFEHLRFRDFGHMLGPKVPRREVLRAPF